MKLCDFGVARVLHNDFSVARTYVGTKAYMAVRLLIVKCQRTDVVLQPEKRFGDEYTIQSDIWSFGVTVIEVCDDYECFNVYVNVLR